MSLSPLRPRAPLRGRTSLGNGKGNPNINSTYGSALDSEAAIRATSDSTAIARKDTLDALLGKTPRPPASTPAVSSPTAQPGRTLNKSPKTNPGSTSGQSIAAGKMTANGESQIGVGDTVEVPGGMFGIVKFIGNVNGKMGIFAGVELTQEFASRGKNDGDVDGVRYFATSVPGSGIFLPAHRATKQDSPTLPSSFPPTPTTPSFGNFDAAHRNIGIPNTSTPPTPSLPRFSKSVGPGSRPNFSQSVGPGASPAVKPKPRSSLARPESPLRKQTPVQQSTPSGNRGSTGLGGSVRGGRPSAVATSATPGKFGSTTPKAAGQARSPSRSNSGFQEYSPIAEDADSTPSASTALASNGLNSTLRNRPRPSSGGQNNAEVQRLKQTLEQRDRQLKDQASSLAEMENSLAELQSLMAHTAATNGGMQSPGDNSEGQDASQLRALLREKNERISTLTMEFDSHRADFRSTIDTLEMASTETERVYEKRVEELLQEVSELRGRSQEVELVARQISQLEELVQELEEGLEDARRGEAEARGEVEFLRGEVERGRSELRREREKAAAALKGADAAMGERGTGPSSPGGSQALEQRDDEIRGLKAIIHSLSAGPDAGSPDIEKPNALAAGSEQDMSRLKDAVEQLEREKGELQGMVERKTFREDELERELARLREYNGNGLDLAAMRDSVISNGRQSVKTVVTADGRPFSHNSARLSTEALQKSGHNRKNTAVLSPTEESISSSVTSETLWCEICETAGHDILTCTEIGGNHTSTVANDEENTSTPAAQEDPDLTQRTAFFAEPKSPMNGDMPKPLQRTGKDVVNEAFKNGRTPLRRMSSREEPSRPPAEALPKPPDGDGPAAGKASGFIDMSKWCAMCERDGHESVDCPFEEEY